MELQTRAANMLSAACQVYTESTDGSNVEAKESALVWHYRDADPDFGHWQVPPLAPACLRVACTDQERLHRSPAFLACARGHAGRLMLRFW